MTVGEWFEGDKIMREDVTLLGEESEYNEKAARFILEKWETDADDLTPKQSAWAGRILDDMVERRINHQRRR
ncbi:MAG: hypothetical protein OEW15_11515 [Nitrospirota bacterium]|nr:hypothetical protein [Nitrospirota bacterium]